MNVVAHQPAAQQDGVRSNIGASALLDAQSGDVEGLPMLALDHVMRHHGIVGRHQLRYALLQNATPLPSET